MSRPPAGRISFNCFASTAVDLVNEANASTLDRAMLEQAADRSIVEGNTVLRQLMRGKLPSFRVSGTIWPASASGMSSRRLRTKRCSSRSGVGSSWSRRAACGGCGCR